LDRLYEEIRSSEHVGSVDPVRPVPWDVRPEVSRNAEKLDARFGCDVGDHHHIGPASAEVPEIIVTVVRDLRPVIDTDDEEVGRGACRNRSGLERCQISRFDPLDLPFRVGEEPVSGEHGDDTKEENEQKDLLWRAPAPLGWLTLRLAGDLGNLRKGFSDARHDRGRLEVRVR
jgi:hypothetical protein